MPLQQRVIEPVNVSRSTLPLPPGDIKPLIKSIAIATGQGLAANAAAAANINIVNELECVTNGTLANLIRQLSSLSRQAEELLTGVFDDASKLLTRTVGLQRRMEALAVKAEALDQPSDAPIILRDPTSQRETFSSDMSCDQQVLSKQQMPSSIAELYQTCDRPPPLNNLDPYRDDGKDGLKFYTDPTYFFELWKRDMMKETIKAQQQQPIPNQQLRQLQKQNQATRSIQQQKRISQQSSQQQQQHIQSQQSFQEGRARQQVVSINGSYTSSTTYVSSLDSNQDAYVQSTNSQVNHQIPRGGIDMERSTEAMTRYMQQTTLNDDSMPYQHQHPTQFQQQPNNLNQRQQQYEMQEQQQPSSHQQSAHQPSYNNAQQHQQQISYVSNADQQNNEQHMLATPPPPPALSPLPPPTSPPPPPPPPAPPAPTQVVPPPQPTIQLPTAAELQQKQQQLRKTVPIQRDPRSDLLAAIKQGITLRRVEDSKRRVEAEKQQSMGNDVASILARRVAMQVSDSDDNGEDDDEDNDWDDSNTR